MTSIELTLADARRLAVSAQRLSAPRPRSILEVVRETGPLQLDPTNAVARSERLVLWSRLGRYDTAELDRLLWEERALFQWRAFVYPREDWPLVAAAGRRYARTSDGRGRQVHDWLRDNAAFRTYVLDELRRRGPLPQRELEDRSVRPWQSRGWTGNRNVSQLLEFLWARGEVLVAARQGQERVWDVAERVLATAPEVGAGEAARIEVDRRVRALGPVTRAGFRRTPALWLLPLDDAFAELVGDGVLVPVRVEGVRGEWYVHRDHAGHRRPFRGRTTLLSPFDPLVYDRRRTADLFGFRYKLEIYVPREKREHGYFVLPILHGDRLVGRVDPLFDRKAGMLRVNAVYAEPGAPERAGPAIAGAVADLAAWIGADAVDYGVVPPVWRGALG